MFLTTIDMPQSLEFSPKQELNKKPCKYHSPSYLFLRTNTYYFRIRIPDDLFYLFGKREYRLSLSTSQIKEARLLMYKLVSFMYEVFEDIRFIKREGLIMKEDNKKAKSKIKPLTSLSDEEIRTYIDTKIKEIKDSFYHDRIGKRQSLSNCEVLSKSIYYKNLSSLNMRNASIVDSSSIDNELQEYLYKNNYHVDTANDKYSEFALDYLGALSACYADISKPSFMIDYRAESRVKAQNVVNVDTSNNEATISKKIENAPSLKEVIEKYLLEKKEDIKKTSIAGVVAQMNLFVEILEANKGCSADTILITSINRDDIREYKSTLKQLPTRKELIKAYKGKSIQELLSMKIDDSNKFSMKTIGNHCKCIITFLNWCEMLEYISNTKSLIGALSFSKNEASQIKEKTKRAFVDKELELMFLNEGFRGLKVSTGGTVKKATQFWTPIIALFTGARLEEICQLYLDDFKQCEQGIHYIDIQDNKDKSLKNNSSRRRIPIHPFLIEIGLLERVELLRAKGEKHLFSRKELSQKEDGKLSASLSKWFSRFIDYWKIRNKEEDVTIEKVTFHSFRNTVATKAKYKNVAHTKLQEVLGHETGAGKITEGYQDKFPVEMLYNDVILKLDFADEINLIELKESARKWLK